MAAKILSKADIFTKKALDTRTVHVEEWGGDVSYKPMTMMERRQIRKRASETVELNGQVTVEVDNESLELWAIIMCALNDKGTPMFDQDDFKALESEMAAGPISTVSLAILGASGMAAGAQNKSED